MVPRDGIPSIVEFVEHREYLGLSISVAQRVLLKAIYGLPLADAEELAMFRECTGRTEYLGQPMDQVTVIAGRRSGKDSRIAAPIAIYEALYGSWGEVAVSAPPGEPIVIPIIANNERNAQIAFKYIAGYVRRHKRLNAHCHDERRAILVLEHAVAVDKEGHHPEIELACYPCTKASARGWSVPAALMDEVAFFAMEAGLEKDEEVQVALEGAGIHYARQIIVKISTPAGKRGLLYEDQKKYWGVNDAAVLVWKAPSLLMNPAINAARVSQVRTRNPDAARSEYDAEFRADVETFLPMDLIQAATVEGRHELGPVEGVDYIAAVDPTGGTGSDAYTLSVVHLAWRDGRPWIIQDVVRGWARVRGGDALNLQQTTHEVAELLKLYRIYTVEGDAYAGDWPAQAFRDEGITYTKSERDKAAAFLEFQPWMARGDIELLDHEQQNREMSLLERKTTLREKKPAIGHPKGGHDDYPNALAQAVAKRASALHAAITWSGEAEPAPKGMVGSALQPLADDNVVPTSDARRWGRPGRLAWTREAVGA